MKIKADLHNHLGTFIYNGDFNKVINISSKKLGKQGILGLVNCDDNRYEKFVESNTQSKDYEREDFGTHIYIPQMEITIVKGQEVFAKEGHILCIGLQKNKHIKSKKLEDALKEAKDYGAIIIADHPFFFEGCGSYLKENPELFDYFDGIEIHNGEAFYGNKKAQEFYEQIRNDYNIGAISSSDGHSLYEIGSSYAILELDNLDIKSLRDSIRAHKDTNNDKQHNSYIGTLDHSLKMICAIATSKFNPVKKN